MTDAHLGHATQCPAGTTHDRSTPEVDLFSPLTLRGVTLRNRIAVSPMCQYCAVDGLADDWHLVHLGSRATGGAGLVIAEATAVTADGRISPGDLGIWSDAHGAALERVAAFIRRMGAVASIQLAHAGRKASCQRPWEGGAAVRPGADGGWQTVAPSAIPFNPNDPTPRALDGADIHAIREAFVAATVRALRAGFQLIDLHAAHGYLLHEFLSPLSNQRTDRYGGSLENRMRLVLEVTAAIRAVMPAELPLIVRISATDWVDGGWDLPQSIELAKALAAAGVDLIDVTTGGLVPHASIPVARNFQVPFAEAIRREAGIKTSAVGLVTEPAQANEIITTGSADLVMLAREMLREPYWALKAAAALQEEAPWPTQYGYAVARRRH